MAQWHHGQPGPYGPPPYGPPPKKGNAGLIAALIAAFVLLVGGGVTAFLLLANRGDLSDEEVAQAREHAEKYVAAINAADFPGAAALSCDERPSGVYDYGVKHGPARLAREPEEVTAMEVVFAVQFETGRPSSIWVSPREAAGGESPWCVGRR